MIVTAEAIVRRLSLLLLPLFLNISPKTPPSHIAAKTLEEPKNALKKPKTNSIADEFDR
jgi:hypothetical protein